MSPPLSHHHLTPPVVPLPVRRLPRVSHIGTMRGEDKKMDSYEGSGLSVCRPAHVADWCRIARLGGSVFTLSRTDDVPGRFVELHRLRMQTGVMQQLYAWAAAQHYIRWGTWYEAVYDAWPTENGDYEERSIRFLTRVEAEYEVGSADGADGADGAHVEEVTGWLPTAAMQQACRWTRLPLCCVEEFAIVLFAEETRPDLDGVWWDDLYEPLEYSCPRGVIFRDRLEQRWHATYRAGSGADG